MDRHASMMAARGSCWRAPRSSGRADSSALEHATAALRLDPASGERLLLLATALDRLGARDSAAAVYLRAAERLPQVADWIKLRAAAVTGRQRDSRSALCGASWIPCPQARIPWADAAAHERTGDRAGAARRYAALGDRLTSLRLRLAFTPDSVPRAAIRRELLALATERAGSAAARDAIALLDSTFAPLTPAEELVVARAAARSGLMFRAVSGFARAGGRAWLRRGSVRLRHRAHAAGRNREAAVQFSQVALPALVRLWQPTSRLAPWCAMARSRKAARPWCESRAPIPVTRRRRHPRFSSGPIWPRTTGRDDEARRLYRLVATRYPTSRFAPTSRFPGRDDRAAEWTAEAGRRGVRCAGRALPAERRGPGRDVLGRPRLGRRRRQRRSPELAGRAVTSRDPLSYYAALSARRLGARSVDPPAAAGLVPGRSRTSTARSCPRRAARPAGPCRRVTLGAGPPDPVGRQLARPASSCLPTHFGAREWRPRPSSSPAGRLPGAPRPTPAPIA